MQKLYNTGVLIGSIGSIKGGTKIKTITIDDLEYPNQLKKIENPPKSLYIEGNVGAIKATSIAIIGSRACSSNGAKLAKKFANELVLQDIAIVSGMAEGIDTAGHIGALDAGGTTIAVLGGGFNHIFPESNIGLFKRIVDAGGAVISEYPPDINVSSKQFLERNRIVSGLSIGVLVIEAAYGSGTSVTAALAKSQGKKVFCVPHEMDNIHGTRHK